MKLATDIAGFVRQSRQDAFPEQLHAYLTAAYQDANVTLLEREATDVLYREVQLDLKGLTESSGANLSHCADALYPLAV